MATTIEPGTEASGARPEPGGHLERDLDLAAQAVVAAEAAAEAAERPPTRIALAVLFPLLAMAIMVGGIFQGISPRFYTVISGAMGVGLAVLLSRLGRKPILTYVLTVVGLFAIGLVMLLPDVGGMFKASALFKDANSAGNILRPPVPFVDGWKLISAWIMGTVGFSAAWLAIVVKKPAFALLLPLPLAAFAAISVPDSQQVVSGLAAFVLFAIGLGLLSSEQATGDEDSRPSASYEIRKAIKALPLIILLIVGLVLGQKYLTFLFPDTLYDPAEEPKKPKTKPLTEVPDKVLFAVSGTIPRDLTGPWRIGSLDVYIDNGWALPPFAASEMIKVEKSGVVDPQIVPQLQATITVKNLTGAVLPVLPNTTGIKAKGPKLSYDARNAHIRLVDGQVANGFTYLVAAAGLPQIKDLRTLVEPLPKSVMQFTEIPDPPPAVESLIAQAPSDNKWDQFDYLRTYILDKVVAKGTGTPVDVPPERVAEMISNPSQGASPFEMVAAQAMLARWIGIPSRIGYGFDGGDKVGATLEVHPRNGAAFVEVYFPTYKWLPVIGVPKQAEPTVGSDPSQQQTNPNIKPSNEAKVQVFVPLVVDPPSVLKDQILRTVLIVVPLILLALLLYYTYPALAKSRLRSKRREAAQRAGTRARVALAYAEWRDHAADFGFLYPTDTPLVYLDRFIEDEEHTELAWLTTRVLWGDLQNEENPLLATVAEELSRSLRRRLAAAQPATVRAVSAVSRISIRHPFAPATDLTHHRTRQLRKERSDEPVTVS